MVLDSDSNKYIHTEKGLTLTIIMEFSIFIRDKIFLFELDLI